MTKHSAAIVESSGTAQPVILPSNQPSDRFYQGGHRISEFRGQLSSESHSPEDWVASTTSVRGEGTTGQSVLPSGELLAAAIERAPLAWLGSAHLDAFGIDTKILVKLLDAGQRLPVHAHPNAAFARDFLEAAHGKAEAWYILSAGEVHLGLRRDISPSELQRLVVEQDTTTMLGLLHHVAVEPHQTVFVPPGVLHAIGEGVFLAEVQEPEDLSILLEWEGFDLDGLNDGHLGLGFELALSAVELTARSSEQVTALITGPRKAAVIEAPGQSETGSVFVEAAKPYFRLEHAVVDQLATFSPGFAVIIVLDGELRLTSDSGDAGQIQKGGTVVVPHAAGTFQLAGHGAVLVARPPVP